MLLQRQVLSAFFALILAGHLPGVHADAMPQDKLRNPNLNQSAPHLPNLSEKLAHPVVSGKLGPWAHAEVRILTSKTIDDAPFRVSVEVFPKTGSTQTFALPPPDQTMEFFLMKARSVIFSPINNHAENSLLILYSSIRIGPQHSPEYGALVYDWTGKEFDRNTSAELRLEGVRNSKEAIARIKLIKPSK